MIMPLVDKVPDCPYLLRVKLYYRENKHSYVENFTYEE